jgi:hypothetical protein
MKNFKKVFFSFVVVFGCVLGNLDAKSMPFTDPKDSKEVVSVLESEMVVACGIYTVICSCGTWEFQWCDNWPDGTPKSPLHFAIQICCGKCNNCVEEPVDPE